MPDPFDPPTPLVQPVRSGGRLRADLAVAIEREDYAARHLQQAEAERDALKAAIERVRALHSAEPGQHPDFCWHDKHELPCPTLAALDAPHSPAEPVSPVSTPTEAHGGTGEAQEG